MARFREMDESAACKAMQPQGKQSDARESFGRDPWIVVDYNNATAGVNADGTPVTTTTEADDESDDGIALPTPIHARATVQCKLVAPDGREAYIYTPIGGFEHLFNAPQGFRGNPRSSHPSSKPLSAGRLQQSQVPGASRQGPAHGTRCQDDMRTQDDRSRNLSESARNYAAPISAKRKSLKRTRSVAQGLSQPRGAFDASDDDNDRDDGDDDRNTEIIVVTETARHCQMGDMKALKNFFRHRIDELTMKPVRGMVTAWIKQLEPKRLGGYGPYHRKLPAEAPADATPPWWPQNVPYIEPAHLDKDSLLTLAVDVLLQHRDSPIDEIKRRSPWTVKLRQIAEYNVETTAPEHFSSSKNAVFSRMMKERAVNSILPSLFETSQSYEDFVFQHELWRYNDESAFPRGKAMTWQPVPRPPKQISQRKYKRARKARKPRVLREESDADSHGEASGDDTEIDETMARIANRQLRRTELSSKRQREEQEEQDGQVVRASAVGLSTVMDAKTPPVSATTQRIFHATQVDSAPKSSFKQTMDRMHPDEDVKAGSLIASDDHEQQSQRGRTPLHHPTQYHNTHSNYTNTSFQPMQASGPFSTSGTSSFAQFPADSYIDASHFSMFNSPYALHMSQSSLDPSMTANSLSYSYPSEELFAPTSFMSTMSDNTNASFNGLPYDMTMAAPEPPHQYSVHQMTARNGRQ